MALHNFLTPLLLLLLLPLLLQLTTAFTTSYHSPFIHSKKKTSAIVRKAFYNDFEGFGSEEEEDNGSSSSNNNSGSDDEDTQDLYAALRQRQSLLDAEKKESLEIWRYAPTTMHALPLRPPPESGMAVDWVRRVAIDTSIATTGRRKNEVVVGGSTGCLYLLNLDTASQYQLSNIHDSGGDDPVLLRYLYGDYDGGGVVALARKDNLVASSGREGGVHLSAITSGQELSALGRIDISATVTSLVVDQNDILWVGTFEDGKIRGYNVEDLIGDEDDDDDDEDTTATTINNLPLLREIKAPSGILNLNVEEEIGCGVAATAKDGILLFSLADGKTLATWNPFEPDEGGARWKNPFDVMIGGLAGPTSEFARSVALVQNDEAVRIPPMRVPDPRDPTNKRAAVMHPVASWSVVVGGSKGSLHQRQLSILPSGMEGGGGVNHDKPWHKMGLPHSVPSRYCHERAIVCLTTPGSGLLISGGQDGTIRGWDCSYLQTTKENPITGRFESDMWLNGVFGSGSKPCCIFGMSGYKVWLGSLVILNGDTLVTDGADNAVIAHYFNSDYNNGNDNDNDEE